jgi:hypothetical protein
MGPPASRADLPTLLVPFTTPTATSGTSTDGQTDTTPTTSGTSTAGETDTTLGTTTTG